MTRAPHLLLAVCFAVSILGFAHVGAWLQKKDGGYLKLSYATFRSITVFDQNGDAVDLNAGGVSSGDYTYISFNSYLE